MNNRSTPINVEYCSTVKYPSCIFSLEKDESYPFERFAYNTIHGSIELLCSKNFVSEITVNFNSNDDLIKPWIINASITFNKGKNGVIENYSFNYPKLLPTIVYLFSVIIMEYIFDFKFINNENSNTKIPERLQYFVDGISSGVRSYKKIGLSSSIRECYDFFKLDILQLQDGFENFDLISKYISWHEIAHAYTLSLIEINNHTKPIDKCAYELIADLLATHWLYMLLVHNTPDTNEYREFRNLSSYSDCIKNNALHGLKTLDGVVILYSLAGAQLSNGRVNLDGGLYHPNGLSRYIFTSIHFYTLVVSNYNKVLTPQDLSEIDEYNKSNISIILHSGLISLEDSTKIVDIEENENRIRAAELIRENNIAELFPIVELLVNVSE